MRVEGFDKLLSMTAKGHQGFSGGYGLARYSIGRWGFFSKYAGIYQRHRSADGKCTSRMAFYRPTNPRSAAQQANRTKFGTAMAVYNGLSPTQKGVLSKDAQKLGMNGWNLFIRRYMRSN